MITTGSGRALYFRYSQSIVTIVIGHLTSLEEHVDHLRAQIERVAGRDEEVRELALRERADVLFRAEDLGWPDRQRLERGLRREAVRDSERRVERHVSRVRSVAGRERELDAGVIQQTRLRIDLVVRHVVARRGLNRAKDHWDFLLREHRTDLVRLRPTLDHDANAI